jgi:hypothetical protein
MDPPRDFLSALQDKYAPKAPEEKASDTPDKPVIISGKVAEEVGFEKIRRKFARLDELKTAILDGTQISKAYASTEQHMNVGPAIREVCPKVTELDLSRNLFVDFRSVIEICSELDQLKSLKIKYVSAVLLTKHES